MLIGFGFAVTGGISWIVYLNIMTFGSDAAGYLLFMSRRIEGYFLIGGMVFIILAIILPHNRGR
ncbi:hypothetical protein [Falsibacillus pallidus]|uniref:Uncharacterized protein n=1 Tax=Falsibacillus pallidus TaxID=493781 RepID=A0A370GYR6_9BACI|nr:hypothetical protein [Falsibacillus pallidus]RDI47774.1 hypothetical protein DFR59_101439 [Falsibacillus pallidus]